MVTFSNALAEVKDDVRRWFPAQAIVRLCHTLGHEYRHRTLGPTETIYAFLLQVLHGNVACGGVRH